MNVIMMKYTDRAIKTISERIENSLGGNVIIVNDSEKETLTVGWNKNDKTVHALQFKKVYSYKDLEELPDPGAVVMDFVKAYRSYKEPVKVKKVEEPEVVKVEKPEVVEEMVKVEESEVVKVVKTPKQK